MLVKGYLHYLYSVLAAGWMTVPGLLAIALLVIGIVLMMRKSAQNPWIARGAFTGALIMLVVTIYTTTIVIEQEFDHVELAKEFPDDESCGTAWSDWLTVGIGLMNTCPTGCYRGATISQEMKLVGFPPYPKLRRELACWKRRNPDGNRKVTVQIPE